MLIKPTPQRLACRRKTFLAEPLSFELKSLKNKELTSDGNLPEGKYDFAVGGAAKSCRRAEKAKIDETIQLIENLRRALAGKNSVTRRAAVGIHISHHDQGALARAEVNGGELPNASWRAKSHGNIGLGRNRRDSLAQDKTYKKNCRQDPSD
jgi:hypothetical protein